MCGRFAQQTDKDKLVEAFRRTLPDLILDGDADFLPRFNIAPSQSILSIGRSMGKPHPKFASLHWGLVPHFAKDPKASPAPINVRSESVAQKPMFRQAFQKRRCLVPADAFYEWKRDGARKQPFCFRMKTGEPFAFAGIYEIWRGNGTIAPLISCAIFTTGANDVLRPVHDRMPVIIGPQDYSLWCDPEMQDAERIAPLLRPWAADQMTGYPVSSHVNSPRNDDASCLTPLAA